MPSPDYLPPDCHDRFAEQVAVDSLRDHLISTVKEPLIELIAQLITDAVKEQEREKHFAALYKALEKHEKKFADMVRGIWDEERRIIIANLKKLKKAYIDKTGDKVDQILYPQKEMEKKLAKGAEKQLEVVVEEMGQKEIERLGLSTAFDVTNPEVQEFLKGYTPEFSKALEKVSVTKLRRELIVGLERGETIPELMKRVNGTYDGWDKIRAENIARSETIRASNKGTLEAYRQSGVVTSKIWVTNPGACDWCSPLDGKVIGLEENWFDKGDSYTVNIDGKKQTMNLNYTDTDAPPLHPMCRCTIAAEFGDVSRVAEWKPAKTIAEAEKWAKKNLGFSHIAYHEKTSLDFINELNRRLFEVKTKMKIAFPKRMSTFSQKDGPVARFLAGKDWIEFDSAESWKALDEALARASKRRLIDFDPTTGEKLYADPFYSSGHPNASIVHELMHKHHYDNYGGSQTDFWGALNSYGRNPQLDDAVLQLGFRVSSYATKNAAEFFAETKTAIILDNKKFDDEVLGLLKKILSGDF